MLLVVIVDDDATAAQTALAVASRLCPYPTGDNRLVRPRSSVRLSGVRLVSRPSVRQFSPCGPAAHYSIGYTCSIGYTSVTSEFKVLLNRS